jgi:membrane fusion protein (multidrug efflux system)
MSEDKAETAKPGATQSAPPEAAAPAVAPRPKPRRSLFRGLVRLSTRLILLVGVPVLAALIGLHYYVKGGRYIDTENAYVKANIVAISADRDGRVVEVLVQDNELVEAGRVLFHLDSLPAILAVRKADAQLDVVRTEIEGYRADFVESLAQAEESKERVRFLEVQYQRQRLLREKKLGKREDFDAAAHDLQMSKRRISLLEKRTKQALAKLTGDPEIAVEQHPRYLEARAFRDQVNVDLERTTVVAPSKGIISNMKLQVGEYVEEGKPVFSLIESAPIWVEMSGSNNRR